MLSVIKINENDNVAVAVNKISKGEIINISGTEIKAEDDIPAGHKIAIYDIENGKDIIKYGFPEPRTSDPGPGHPIKRLTDV